MRKLNELSQDEYKVVMGAQVDGRAYVDGITQPIINKLVDDGYLEKLGERHFVLTGEGARLAEIETLRRHIARLGGTSIDGANVLAAIQETLERYRLNEISHDQWPGWAKGYLVLIDLISPPK